MRKDDFLYIKLGSIKPKCSPVKYTDPTPEARSREAEIKQIVEQQFGDHLKQPQEPRFSFVSALSELPEAKSDVVSGNTPSEHDAPRFAYSYFAVYGDPLSDPALDPYPDGLLARLQQVGVNGVWLHVALRQLAWRRGLSRMGRRLGNTISQLGKIVARAKHYGIDVYLYMNEPRAMPKEFFANRPDMQGVSEEDYSAVCTSNPKVRQMAERFAGSCLS